MEKIIMIEVIISVSVPLLMHLYRRNQFIHLSKTQKQYTDT